MRIFVLIATVVISAATAQAASAGGITLAANEQAQPAKTPEQPAATAQPAAPATTAGQPKAAENDPQAKPRIVKRKYKRRYMTFDQRVRFEFAMFERSLRHGFRGAFRW